MSAAPPPCIPTAPSLRSAPPPSTTHPSTAPVHHECHSSSVRRPVSSRSQSAHCAGPASGNIQMSAPCLRLQRFAAIRRTQAASTRSASAHLLKDASLCFEKIDQTLKWAHADHVLCVSYEIRQRIDVVISQSSVAFIHDVFNPSDINLRFLHNSLARSDHLAWRSKPFDLQPGLRCIDRASIADQFDAVGALANVSRAQIERVASCEDLDGIQKLAAQRFDACDVAAAGGDIFLHQRHLSPAN